MKIRPVGAELFHEFID